MSLTRSDATPRSRTKRGSDMDARLHTAVSSGLVYSRISVHRLLHLIVPCHDTGLILKMDTQQTQQNTCITGQNSGSVAPDAKPAAAPGCRLLRHVTLPVI